MVIEQTLEISVKIKSRVITDEMKLMLLMNIARQLAIKPKTEELVCIHESI